MATEVMRMEFTFRPRREWVPILDITKKVEKIVEDLPFCYNAIHDIESAWWVGVWMLFFHMPKGHTESSQISNERQFRTDMIFTGTSNFGNRLQTFESPQSFVRTTAGWISEECLPAVGVFDNVRDLILTTYLNLEKTFPDGLGKLSEKAQAHPDGHHDSFPGGPEEDIYKPIQDAFIEAEEFYGSRKTEIVPVRAGERD